MKTSIKWMTTAAIVLTIGCTKKKENSAAAAADTAATPTESTTKVSASLSAPVGVLNLAINSMQSAMATDISSRMLGSTTLHLEGDDGFTEADCNEHGAALAREGDDETYKDNSGRLRLTHPRAALQNMYCQMQKDTGSPDTFLGALSQNKMLFCVIGSDLQFDGEAHEKIITKAAIEACLGDLTTEQKEEMLEGIADEQTAVLTATSPATFGAAGEWDGSIHLQMPLGESEVNLKILMKDSDGIVAVAVNDSANRALNVDGYAAAINKTTGEIRFEAKFQRIRTPTGTSNNGWNRHARAYVKGEFDANFIFTSVSEIQGIYSDLSINPPGDSGASSQDDPVQMASAWTVSGSDSDSFKTHAYELTCAYDGASSICDDPNLSASWAPTAGSAACNGALTGHSCARSGIEIASGADTAFMMDLNHPDFETTETWFANLKVPSFTTLSLAITQ